MARILHVIDPANEWVGPCVCRLVADALSVSSRDYHEAVVIGSTAAEQMARSAGLYTTDRISAVAGCAYLSVAAFRRFVRCAGPFNVIHAWSLSTLTLAVLAEPNVPKVLYLSGNPGSASAAKWLRILVNGAWHGNIFRGNGGGSGGGSGGGAQVLAMSHSVKRVWVETGGIDPKRITVVRPGLDFGMIRAGERDSIRKRWGVPVGEVPAGGALSGLALPRGALSGGGPLADELVLAPLAHPAKCLDAKAMVAALVLTGLSGLKATMVLPPGAKGLSSAYQLLKSTNAGIRLVVDELMSEPWRALPGVDAVVITGDDTKCSGWGNSGENSGGNSGGVGVSGVLPMLWAAAAGRTIIAEAGYGVSEFIEHGHSGYLVKPGDRRGLVSRIRESAVGGMEAVKMRDTARSEAFSLFSRSRFAENLGLVYRQILAHDDVSIPDLPLSGGMRFAGRF